MLSFKTNKLHFPKISSDKMYDYTFQCKTVIVYLFKNKTIEQIYFLIFCTSNPTSLAFVRSTSYSHTSDVFFHL